MFEWITEHPALVWWLLGLSVATFLGTLLAVPLLVVRMPADYFVLKKQPKRLATINPILAWIALIAKNLLGVLLVVAGLAMLVLPGQGVITILIGITLINFPGKYALERWLVSRKPVSNAVNWMRLKAGRPPLLPVDHDPDHPDNQTGNADPE